MCDMLSSDKCSQGYVPMLRTVLTAPGELCTTEIKILASDIG